MIVPLCRLFRLRLALVNGSAAAAGCLLFPGPANAVTVGAAFLGVTLLAAGGSAGNQLLERNLDLLMARTRNRPLPSREMTPTTAAAWGGIAIAAGMGVLAKGGWLPPLLGLATLAWYLAVYTPLKRRTSLAIAVGALCGAMPPVIGWRLAGGSSLDFPIVILAGVLFLWQVPHFWLLQRRHADDFQHAGFPLLPQSGFLPPALCRLWLMALVAAGLLLPAFGLIATTKATLSCSLLLLPLLLTPFFPRQSFLFFHLNLSPALLALVLLVEKVFAFRL